MPDLTREFKVGILFIGAISLLVYFVLRTDDRPFGMSKGYQLLTTVQSAEGVIQGSAVEIAGVQIGSVRKIELTPDGKATIELEIDPKFKLPSDTKIALKTRGMLGDRYVQIIPGTSETLLQAGGEITQFEKGMDIDALTARADTISKDIEAITAEMKSILTSDENKASIETILKNSASLSGDLSKLTQNTERDLARVVKDVSELTNQMKSILAHADTIIDVTGTGVQAQMKSLEALTTRLDATMKDVQSVTSKLERGEGTIGALLNDRSLVDQVEQTVTDVQELVATVDRIQTQVSYEGEVFAVGADTYAGEMRNTLGIELRPREDYGYRIELVSDPMGNHTDQTTVYSGVWFDGTQVGEMPQTFVQTTITDDFLLSLQFMRRWNDLQLRLGIKQSSGGVGADYFLMNDRLSLHADLYAFGGYNLYPNLKLQARYNFLDMLYLSAGADDTLNGLLIPEGTESGFPTRTNIFVGGGFHFRDDQLKLLMSVLPTPSN